MATSSPRATTLSLTRLLGRDVDWDTPYAKGLGFLLVAAQAVVLVLLARRFRLEDPRFQLVFQASVAGFLIHHFLPQRWRMPFFLTLSLGTIAYFLGLGQGPWQLTQSLARTGTLVGVGLALIGICHLPLAFGLRVGLLLLAGAGLAVFRGGWMKFGPLDAIWPILGAMFMLRLIVYVYDIEHDKEPAQFFRTLSYFFLLPNLWLYVFPVIDYRTFCRNYFNDRPLAIYQKGINWMMRGMLQLFVWRLVYYQLYLDPSRVTDGTTLIQYVLSNVALYLRVSGQFHLVIGLLHLFGFNLPETNHRYFLASSFTDYWRRANIYWKDFMVKVFYYPLVVRFKRWGTTGSAVAATAIAFVITWLLHSYQWFWLRGGFPVEAKDVVFWGALGVLVCVNSFSEMKFGRKRTLGKKVFTWGDASRLALRTSGTFLATTTLWSIWSCDSMTQWLEAWSHADLKTLGWGLLVLALIGIAAILIEAPSRPWNTREPGKVAAASRDTGPFPWRNAALACFLPAAVVYASNSRLTNNVRPDVRIVLDSLWKNTPNKTDEEYMVRGYYENLMDPSRFGAAVNAADRGQPADWKRLEDTEMLVGVADLRTKELVPNKAVTVNGKLVRTNSFGIRDREYDLVKPPGTYRIALLGSSVVMAWNAGQEEGFEPLLEERLNRDRSRSQGRIEILNFAVNGYSPLSQVDVLRAKAFALRPDAVVFVAHPEDFRFTMRTFAATLRMGGVLRDAALQQIAAKAGIDAKTPNNWAERRLIHYWPDLVGWAFREAVTECRQRGITPILVYLPGVLAQGRTETDEKLLGLARDAGFVMISLFDIFRGADRSKWMVAPWDAHPNAAGHQLIADRLFEVLQATDGLNISNAVSKAERKP